MDKKPDILRFIDFTNLLLKLRAIERKVNLPPDNIEAENDVEHSYIIAMSAWYLSQYFPEIDTDKVVKMSLVHDMLEIHAGDTDAYGSREVIDSKKERETKAIQKLKDDWRDFPEMNDAINEYESRQTQESKFVYALDKMLPGIIIYIGNGEWWHARGITLEKYLGEKLAKIKLSNEIKSYHDRFLEILRENPNIFPVEDTKKPNDIITK